MIAEIHNKLRDAKRIRCSQIIVRDRFDQPIAIICEHSPGHYFCKWYGEEGFDDTLKLMGIGATSLVRETK